MTLFFQNATCYNLSDQEASSVSADDENMMMGMQHQHHHQLQVATTSGNNSNNNNGSGGNNNHHGDAATPGVMSGAGCYGRNMTFPRFGSGSSSYRSATGPRHHELPAIVTEGENYRLSAEHLANNSCSESHLSGLMPDVAMATASFDALQLVEAHELELDLGDGASHLLQQQQPPQASSSSSSSLLAGASGISTIRLPLGHNQQQQHQQPQQQQQQQQQQRQRQYAGLQTAPYLYHRAIRGNPRLI
ncbi:unnamed protein product [Trichogramma brassicae]|uniref:Uncharacterized protein n=1 Tax=Trichogramma brassicae TaxID=86971 RepID=A0A6H5IBP0_9HYME|nr:unnamed protein product [Trichogramma brassicae]